MITTESVPVPAINSSEALKVKKKSENGVDLHLLLKYTLISIKVAPVKRDA